MGAQVNAGPIVSRSIKVRNVSTKPVASGYLPVGDLQMYHEVYGEGNPLVLLHGAFSAIGTSFGKLIPGLAEKRQVIGLEMQAHGRTADIDRPLTLEALADDVAVVLDHLGLENADLFGYSTGGSVALHATLRHPEKVRKLVMASVGYTLGGIHPGLMDGLGEMEPEMMFGSPWHDEYLEIAPRPEDFATLFAKKAEMDRGIKDFAPETIETIESPVLLIIGDSDLITLEHAVEFFRLLGGGVFGDTPAGLAASRLAILPGTSHVTMVNQTDLIVPMVNSFLDAEVPSISG